MALDPTIKQVLIVGGAAPGEPPAFQLIGSNMERFVADEGDMPDATSVPVGCAVMVVNTGDVWQSNGSGWVRLA